MEINDAQFFILYDQATVKSFVLRCNTRRAGIGVALQRLNAAQCQHHATPAVAHVGTEGAFFNHIEARDDFPASDDCDFIAYTDAFKCVTHENKCIVERCAYVVDVFQGCSPGAAFSAVHGDEVGQYVGA